MLEKPEAVTGRVAEDKVSEVMGGQTIWGPPGHMKIFGFYSESLQDLEQEGGIIWHIFAVVGHTLQGRGTCRKFS